MVVISVEESETDKWFLKTMVKVVVVTSVEKAKLTSGQVVVKVSGCVG